MATIGEWHGNPEKYDKEELRGHQKRAQRVDEHKTKWALLHSIPILRFWESDIRKNPKKVMKILKEELGKRNRQIVGLEGMQRDIDLVDPRC